MASKRQSALEGLKAAFFKATTDMETDVKHSGAPQLLQAMKDKKLLTVVMDITSSYADWQARTGKAIPEIMSNYSFGRYIGMNDNCGQGLDHHCETCVQSVRVEPWRADVKLLQDDFKKHACKGGNDAPEKPACVLRFLVREYEKGSMNKGQHHDIVMFFDTVGHGVYTPIQGDYVADSYPGGCPNPSTCGCGGDVIAQALKLKEFGARVCIIAPNRSLDVPLFAVYAASIVKITGGWLAALPDDQDLEQFQALRILGADRSQAFDMFRKAHADDDTGLMQEFEDGLKVLMQVFTERKGSVGPEWHQAMKEFEAKYTMAQLPGLVMVEGFNDTMLGVLVGASKGKFGIAALKRNFLDISKNVEVSVFAARESRPAAAAPPPATFYPTLITDLPPPLMVTEPSAPPVQPAIAPGDTTTNTETTKRRVRARYIKRSRKPREAAAAAQGVSDRLIAVFL